MDSDNEIFNFYGQNNIPKKTNKEDHIIEGDIDSREIEEISEEEEEAIEDIEVEEEEEESEDIEDIEEEDIGEIDLEEI